MDFGATKAKRMLVGIYCMINFRRINRSTKFKALKVQLDSFVSNLRSSSSHTDMLRGLVVRGEIKYFEERNLFLKPIKQEIWSWMACGALKKKIWDLPVFISLLEATTKVSSIFHPRVTFWNYYRFRPFNVDIKIFFQFAQPFISNKLSILKMPSSIFTTIF